MTVKNVEICILILCKTQKSYINAVIINYSSSNSGQKKEEIMSRKGENIYKRKDKRWEGRYIVSYNVDGKAKYKSVYGHSYTEVKLKMKNRTDVENTKRINILLTEWIEDYLKLHMKQIKISTLKIYERYLYKYIEPFFGKIILRKMNKDILQSFVSSMSDLSPSTMKGIFSFLRETLKKANKEGYITPIWLDIELPKIKKNKVEVFTRDEQKRIEHAISIEESPNEIGILICLYTGLRIGEVCGLKWDDINLVSGVLTVNRTVQRITINGKSVLQELLPKTETSNRKIPLPSCVVDKLNLVKKNSKSKYVLNTNFHVMDPRTFQYQYKKILERADVRYSNAHTLRHTFSVRALELGFDIKTLSEILGHSDSTITLKTYAHSLDEHKRNSMERFEKIIS